jgi:hypothetical protein
MVCCRDSCRSRNLHTGHDYGRDQKLSLFFFASAVLGASTKPLRGMSKIICLLPSGLWRKTAILLPGAYFMQKRSLSGASGSQMNSTDKKTKGFYADTAASLKR